MTEPLAPHEHVEVKKHSAGIFDIRNIIGSLMLIYGVVLLIMGLVNSSDEDLVKSDGFNINVWAGIGMILLGVFFVGWSVLRPVVVQSIEVVSDDDTAGDNTGGATEG